MQAVETTQPHTGEWYSFSELFDAYPDNWVLLAFPDELTPNEEWDIMNIRGVLIAMNQKKSVVWQALRLYADEHPNVQTFFFATERPDDEIVLI
jgi:hypothetical protein